VLTIGCQKQALLADENRLQPFAAQAMATNGELLAIEVEQFPVIHGIETKS